MSTVNKNQPATVTSQNPNLTPQQTQDLAKLNADYAKAEKGQSKGDKALKAIFGVNKQDIAKAAVRKDLAKLSKDGFDTADIKNIKDQVGLGDAASHISKLISKGGLLSEHATKGAIHNAFHAYARNNGVPQNAASYQDFAAKIKPALQQTGTSDANIDDALSKAAPQVSSLKISDLQGGSQKA